MSRERVWDLLSEKMATYVSAGPSTTYVFVDAPDAPCRHMVRDPRDVSNVVRCGSVRRRFSHELQLRGCDEPKTKFYVCERGHVCVG